MPPQAAPARRESAHFAGLEAVGTPQRSQQSSQLIATLAAMGHAFNFNGQTQTHLKEAGWHAGRLVNTKQWEAELAADGFPPLHSVALRFLAEFGGLVFPHAGPGVTRAREAFTFVPTDCTSEADSSSNGASTLTGTSPLRGTGRATPTRGRCSASTSTKIYISSSIGWRR
jgi:hypothetical protein